MKWYKKIIAWAMLSLVLQFGGLYVLDNFVFKHSSNFASKKIDLEKEKTAEIKATIPKGAENINISYNGRYLTYTQGGTLYIQNTKNAETSQVKTENGGSIIYSKWLSDRDRLIIGEKIIKGGKEVIQLITYNAKNSTIADVGTICEYQDDMEVKKISESTITGVYYIDIYKGGLKSTVYRIDINNDKSVMSLQSSVLGNMEVIPHKDRLIYQDEITKKFYITSPNGELKFNTNKNLTLLGIDRQDIVYVGELNGEKISSVIYGNSDEDTSTWKTINLEAVVNKNELYFNKNSEILINDNLKGVVKNLTTGEEVEYEGKLLQIKESFIATMDNDGKVTYKSLVSSKG